MQVQLQKNQEEQQIAHLNALLKEETSIDDIFVFIHFNYLEGTSQINFRRLDDSLIFGLEGFGKISFNGTGAHDSTYTTTGIFFTIEGLLQISTEWEQDNHYLFLEIK